VGSSCRSARFADFRKKKKGNSREETKELKNARSREDERLSG
jgi:hypothetical protein